MLFAAVCVGQFSIVLLLVMYEMLQHYPSNCTTLHFEYYEETDESKIDKKVGRVYTSILLVQSILY